MESVLDMTVWYQQIEQISEHANKWLNFSLICGVIGFCLAAAALIYLIIERKK